MDVIKILQFLGKKDRNVLSMLEFNGFFKDQLNRDYISESTYNLKEMLDTSRIS